MRPFRIITAGLLLCLLLTGCGRNNGTPAPTFQKTTVTEATVPVETVDERETLEELTTIVTAGDIYQLNAYTNLKKLDLSGSDCYDAIQRYCDSHPQVEVTYTVSMGSAPIDNHSTSATLEDSSFSYSALMENLKYLPQLRSLSLPKTSLTSGEITALQEAWPEIEISYTVVVLGQEYPADTTELNLSSMTSSQVEEAASQLGHLTNLTFVELMGGNGNLRMADVKKLVDAAPEVSFHYTFTLFGKTVSTNDETVEFRGISLKGDGETQLREALGIMSGCKAFIVRTDELTNEEMAAIRKDFPNTELVWPLTFSSRTTSRTILTNEESFWAAGVVSNDNCQKLRYCTDLKNLDVGHCDELTDLSFLENLTELEILIASGCKASDLTGIENCKKLEFLELAYCKNLKDLTPVAGCSGLRHLNVSYTAVSDLTPLDGLTLEQFCCKRARVAPEEQEIFMAIHPDCITSFFGPQPYGQGWRYIDNGFTFTEIYKRVRAAFNYDAVDAYYKALENANG